MARLPSILVASISLSLLALVPPTASPPANIAVRWTGALTLTHADLDDIPTFLAKPVPIGGNENSSRPEMINAAGETRNPVSGFQWLDARDEGFKFKTNADNKMESWYRLRVLPALWLASAKPSRRSYVDTLTINKDITDWLPAAVCSAPGEDQINALTAKLKRTPTWSEAYPHCTVTLDHKGTADIFDGDNAHTLVSILGYGDVTGDGMEDVLLSITTRLDQGTWYVNELVTISRRHPKLPLVVCGLK